MWRECVCGLIREAVVDTVTVGAGPTGQLSSTPKKIQSRFPRKSGPFQVVCQRLPGEEVSPRPLKQSARHSLLAVRLLHLSHREQGAPDCVAFKLPQMARSRASVIMGLTMCLSDDADPCLLGPQNGSCHL